MIFSGDSIKVTLKDYWPSPHPVPYGTDVTGVYFDGYPQIVKQEGSKPVYGVKTEKDIMVAMRDGVRIAIDVYRPDVEGKKFPAILAWGIWGKEPQEMVRWLAEAPQPYHQSPFWDGNMEAGNYMYTVPRGYAHVIPDPRGIGKSEGYGTAQAWDIYDTIEWIAAQSWCNGQVGMMGPSSYSMSQISAAQRPHPSLKAIRPDEAILFTGEHFHGIWDTLPFHIEFGRHGNDSALVMPSYPYTPSPPRMLSLPKEELGRRLKEAFDHPDIKYNSKFYSFLKYPMKSPLTFDSLLESFHPRPYPSPGGMRQSPHVDKITLPMYIGTPWVTRLYIWGTFEIYEKAGTPQQNKKLIVYPPGFPARPYVQYHDELIRWYDHWLKGIDTGIMDEPPIKLFVMGVNKWRFEKEWPLARTEWTKFYLHPKGGLSTKPVAGSPEPETFTQPAPYLDPTVYCLRYGTRPFEKETEITGPIALYLDASIDKDDTNWMVDLVDVDSEGNRQWISSGFLKAAHRAIDETKTKPYQPIHPRKDPVPVPPGKVVSYAIAMMPTSNRFQKGHSMELIIRNQDDLLSRLGTWGVYMLPFMQTVTHTIHFGNSHLLLPVIP